MFIFGTRKISAVFTVKRVAFVLFASTSSIAVFAQSDSTPPASVTVQTGDANLSAPPSIGAQLSSQEKPTKANELFAPITKANTPKIYVKSARQACP